jgi:Tol biopolymer transport system component
MHIRLLLTLGVCMTLLLASCGGGGHPRPDLVFVSTRDGDYAMYAMNADGGRQERLTKAHPDTSSPAGLFFQIDPAWSPDGAAIAFASKRAGTFDIYVMHVKHADGTRVQRLTATRADDTHPSWSSDGQQLAFARAGDIYAMRADGSDVRAVSRGPASDGDPAWSPDGKWIAFVRRQPGTPVREIWIMRPDGSDSHELTSLHGSSINPSWSPDGSRIVFASDIVASLYDLYIVTVGDKRVHRLTRQGSDTFEPAWSPDGSEIAFSQDGAISTVDLKGETVKLTNSKNNDSSPVWNPKPPPEGS